MTQSADKPLVRDPVYQQLNERLRDLMTGQEFVAGARFLTERQVAERFGVSRPTANKALTSLVTEGLLEFRKGVGTFVRQPLDYNLRHLVSFTEQARAQGKLASTQVLLFRALACAPTEQVRLVLPGALFEVERLRLADGVPVILERRFVAAECCPNLAHDDLTGSLYAAWTERHGLKLTGADEVIRAVNLHARGAELLGVPVGSAALVVEATGYSRVVAQLCRSRTHPLIGFSVMPLGRS
jgi:GntR family transcriptional regulator